MRRVLGGIATGVGEAVSEPPDDKPVYAFLFERGRS
jgi:hypothetical protein